VVHKTDNALVSKMNLNSKHDFNRVLTFFKETGKKYMEKRENKGSKMNGK